MLDKLKILQNNLHKSKERTHSILNDPDMKQHAILILQEQYWSPYMKSSPLHNSWTLTEPAALDDLPPRVAIYTNNKIIPPSYVAPVALPFRDVIAIVLHTTCTKPSLFINIYNPCDEDILSSLQLYLQENINRRDYDLIIMAGDFNSHHPLWNPQGYLKHDEEADTLIDIAAMLGLNLLLSPGTIIYPNASTTIDLMWGNNEAVDRLIFCKIADEHDHCSDHLPIEASIGLEMETPQPVLQYNYAKTNWNELNRKLSLYLPKLIHTDANMVTSQDIDTFTEGLNGAISKAVQETTLRKKPCPHSKRWWNEDLTSHRQEANRLRNIYHRTKAEADKVIWREKANQYISKIAQAKRDKWREVINNADAKSIWQVKKYVANVPVSTFVPTLDGQAASQSQKVELLQKSFFPHPPLARLDDIPLAIYPQEVPFSSKITIKQIREAVRKLAPDKAPGPDEIPNRVLQTTLETTERHLQALMQASLNLAYFPKPFKHTTTVVLRKPSKPDYTKAKAYRLIALENTLGKVMESIITEIMSYLTETYQLLPVQHFGGRPGRSTEDAILILSESIHKVWKEKMIYTAIDLDVAGAFNNVHHKRLAHNLKMRRIPHLIVLWIISFLKGRSTQLQFNGAKSDRIPTPAGVPQGSPLSPLLYMYYNADLLDIAQNRGISLGFIDDVVIGVQRRTDIANVRKLKPILKETEEWRRRHGVQFEPSKYILVHYTRNRGQPTMAPITIGSTIIRPSNEAKYLGVIFDQELRFKSHLQYVIKKGTVAALALASISKSE